MLCLLLLPFLLQSMMYEYDAVSSNNSLRVLNKVENVAAAYRPPIVNVSSPFKCVEMFFSFSYSSKYACLISGYLKAPPTNSTSLMSESLKLFRDTKSLRQESIVSKYFLEVRFSVISSLKIKSLNVLSTIKPSR